MLQLVALFIALCAVIVNGQQEIIGCGGFVQSSVPINYEKVELKLFTKQGAFRSKTECAPNNGYFLVAVYDKGEYTLKIESQNGWGFAPKEIKLNIDGKTDPCSKQEDINFKFTGFSISGTIGSLGRDQGPSGVTLHLKDAGGVVSETQSMDGGSFKFEDVMPGEYTIVASHASWTFQNNQANVVITNDNAGNIDNLVVKGYDVKGSVLSGGEPIQGVALMVFSDQVKKEHIAQCDEIAPSALERLSVKIPSQPLCQVVSDETGSFFFPQLPSGEYSLVPFYSAHNIMFDVVPSSIKFNINFKGIHLKTPFQVYGFSVNGRIVDSLGNGIDGASVEATNEHSEVRSAISTEDGKYLLENVTTGNFVFKVTKENIGFDERKMYITPNTPALADIAASIYSVCGQIEVFHLPTGVLPINQRKLHIQKVDGNSSSQTVDSEGKFCFNAAPGDYKIEALVAPSELGKGFLLKPGVVDLKVINQPIAGIKFTQFRASVAGRLNCIGSCEDAQVYLHPVDKPNEKTFSGEVAPIEEGSNVNSFVFANVLPGKYKLGPVKKKWCWKSPAGPSSQEVTVTSEDVNDLVFNHDGYFLKCKISHNITLDFLLEDQQDAVGSFNLLQGTNRFCLKTAGVYKLTPKSCYQFEKESYKYETKAPESLSLNVVRYKVKISINTDKQISDLQLAVRSTLEDTETILTPTAVAAPETEVTNLYEAVAWGRKNEELIITPQSKQVLFSPKTKAITLQESCPGGVASFDASEGVFIQGLVTPGLADVKITISVQPRDEELAKVVNVLTDEAGQYRVGPMHSDVVYDVTAVKEGYHITPKEGETGSFVAQRLSKITVKVHDSAAKADESSEDAAVPASPVGSPMASVLLSLSGRKFRNNNLTNEEGVFEFNNLNPGQYYLRPMQKEYSFEPNTKMLDVREGEELTVIIKGNRVAFSAHGSVSSLAGVPSEAVLVQAVGLEHCSEYGEETTTDALGMYRLRGLQPDCSYAIKMGSAESNPTIERLAPVGQIIKIEGADIANVNFISFTKSNKFDVTANIDASYDHLPTLKVYIYEDSNPESPIHTINPGLVKFVQFPPLKPEGSYTVKLASTLSLKTHDIKTNTITFSSETELKKHITLKFEAKERHMDMEPIQSRAMLPFMVALIFICYNYDSALAFLLRMQNFVQRIGKGEAESGGESDPDEMSTRSSKSSKKRR